MHKQEIAGNKGAAACHGPCRAFLAARLEASRESRDKPPYQGLAGIAPRLPRIEIG